MVIFTSSPPEFVDNYFIKKEYKINETPKYYLDAPSYITYQPDVYKLARYLMEMSSAKYIIDIGSGNGLKLKNFINKDTIVCIDYKENLNLIKQVNPNWDIINYNLEYGLPKIDKDFLEDSIVICSDVVEHIKNPKRLFEGLSEMSFYCKYMLISTPDRVKTRGVGDFGPPKNLSHVREWSIDEFSSLLNGFQFSKFMIGYTVNSDFHLWKNTILALSGKEIAIEKLKSVKILAIIHCYNEIDFIETTIIYLLNQQIDIKILDNWSDDGTYEKLLQLQEKYGECLIVDRFPQKPTDNYEWFTQLKETEKIANENNDYDWFLHYDSDEIRISPWKNVTLADAIAFVDKLGYNALDFNILDFRPVENDNIYTNLPIIERNRYFEFTDHYNQIKAWKKIKGIKISLAHSGGHEVEFVGRKIYPLKFLTKHYPLRTQKQSLKKVYQDRFPRFKKERNTLGWHIHYDKYIINNEQNFLFDKRNLINWDEENFMAEYLVERISEIGLYKKRINL